MNITYILHCSHTNTEVIPMYAIHTTKQQIHILTISTRVLSGGPDGPFLSPPVSDEVELLEMLSKKSSLSLSNTLSIASFLASFLAPFLLLFFGC